MLESRGLEVVLGHVYGVEGMLGLWECPMERRRLLGYPWVMVGICGAQEMARPSWVRGNIFGMQRAGKAHPWVLGCICGAQGLSFLFMPLV